MNPRRGGGSKRSSSGGNLENDLEDIVTVDADLVEIDPSLPGGSRRLSQCQIISNPMALRSLQQPPSQQTQPPSRTSSSPRVSIAEGAKGTKKKEK